MNTPEDDKLDAMMRDWAGRHAASEQKLDGLARRVCDQLRDLPAQADSDNARRVTSPRNLVWAAACGALAASIALVIYIADLVVDSSAPPLTVNAPRAQSLDSKSSPIAPISRPDIAEKELLVRELQEMFPGRFAWFMETGDKMELGLSKDDNIRPARIIAVRFVIESQGREERDWKTLRTFDFVTLSEEMVETSRSPDCGARVAFWTYAMPDGMISIDAELSVTGPVPIHVSSSRLISAGSPTAIWQAEQDGVKYRVHQVAELIDNDRIG